jgi:hypothetical protein
LCTYDRTALIEFIHIIELRQVTSIRQRLKSRTVDSLAKRVHRLQHSGVILSDDEQRRSDNLPGVSEKIQLLNRLRSSNKPSVEVSWIICAISP